MSASQVSTTTLTQRVYGHLKDRILNAELKPGTRLVTQQLANEIGVSLTPVRESLRLLEKDELVENIPRRGAVVTTRTREVYEQVFAVRRVLEAAAARLAAVHAQEHDLKTMQESIEDLRRTSAGNDMAAHMSADRRFHCAVAAASGNSVLEQMVVSLGDRMQPFSWPLSVDLAEENRDWVEHGPTEHTLVIDAIKRRDADEAERRMIEHIDNSLHRGIKRGGFFGGG